MINIIGSDVVSEIHIGNDMFNRAASICVEKFNMKKLHIITDENLESIYLEPLISQISELVYEEDSPDFYEDFEISYSVIPSGEMSKNLSTVSDIYESLAEMNFSRDDLIIALGGGVVGDISGFVAATYLRGVKLCQIPTSLLAQVDSSVGGKNGINLSMGKNLVGSFYQPHIVIVDPLLLQTLPESDFSDGVAEIIKYGLIKDPSLLEKLKEYKAVDGKDKRDFDLLSDIIYRCIEIKKYYVEADEKDLGIRAILNFGHTIGHAVEKLGGYKEYTHGKAVAIGMVRALDLFKPEKERIKETLIELLSLYNLPTEAPYEEEAIIEAVKSDKKASGNGLNFIIIKDAGHAEILEIDIDILLKKLKECV